MTTRKLLTLTAMLALLVTAPALAQDPNYPTQQQQPTQATDPTATTTSTEEELPATASPQALVGLSGLAAVATGLWLARPRRKA